MDLQIKILLEKYYNGESSLEEEEILKKYFSKETNRSNDLNDNLIFNYFREEKTEIPYDLTYELDKIIKNQSSTDKARIFRILKWTGSIAAILLICVLFYVFSKKDNQVKDKDLYADSFQNTDEAYKETQKVLLFISQTMNKKSSGLKHLSSFDKSMKQCARISKIDETINSVKK